MISRKMGGLIAAASLATMLVGVAAPASAQYGYGGPPPGGGYGGPPPGGGYDRPPPRGGGYGEGPPPARGSFRRTCTNVRQDGFYLSASCQTAYGGYRESSIDLRSCRRFGNRNGQLFCE